MQQYTERENVIASDTNFLQINCVQYAVYPVETIVSSIRLFAQFGRNVSYRSSPVSQMSALEE